MKRWVMIGLALLMLFPVEAARKSRKTVVEATTPAVRPALSEQDRQAFDSVYYTHLTLPTNREVEVSGGAVLMKTKNDSFNTERK